MSYADDGWIKSYLDQNPMRLDPSIATESSFEEQKSPKFIVHSF